MKYIRLLDSKNNGRILKVENGLGYRYIFGADRWEFTGIYLFYSWPEDPLYDLYETITEDEALVDIEQQKIYFTNMLVTAEQIARKAHAQQFDKGGKDYINHPLAVAAQLENPEEKIVALLHDIIEDTDVTPEDLRKAGLKEYLIEAVLIMTKTRDCSYDEYLKEVRHYEFTRPVKIADIRHNMDLSRIQNPSQTDFDRVEKYKKALDFLTSE